jgi:uroporphyrinogen-III synthase
VTATLRGLRIWCTRPGRAGERSCGKLYELGARVRQAATVTIEPVVPDAATLATIRDRASELVLGLTSPTSTENFVSVCGATRPDGTPWRAVAVGKRTAIRARDLGLEVIDVAPRATAQDLAPILARASETSAVLVPGSNLRRAALGDALRQSDREVIELQVQETRPLKGLPPGLIRPAEEFDLLIAYSPSALGFIESLDATTRESVLSIPVAVMGPTTGHSARELGLEVVIEPEDPDEDRLIGLVCGWYQRG